MTKDLEDTLAELGPEYRAVVDRLLGTPRPVRTLPRLGTLAAAASVLVLLGLGFLFREPAVPRADSFRTAYTAAYASDDAALASILASQRADGSWGNDFITCQNAAVLRGARDEAQHIAYKKALRYLRSRGLRPLSDDELRARVVAAARILAKTLS